MLHSLLGDVRYTLGWLRRSPGFASIAIVSLAVGIGLNTALFTVVDAVLLRPLPVERVNRLVDVYTSGRDGRRYVTSSYPDFLDVKADNRVFSDMIAYSPAIDVVNLSDRSRIALGEVVSGNYFQLLGVKAFTGRTLTPDDDRPGAPRAVVISHKMWAGEYEKDSALVGKLLRLRGQVYTIVGVAPSDFTGTFPVISSELWTPLAYVDDTTPVGMVDTVPSPTGTSRRDRRGYRWLFVKGRLNDSQEFDSVAANLRVIMQQLATAYPETNKDRLASAIRTTDVRIHPEADRMIRLIAVGLTLVVGLVLLVSCANVAGLLLARASGRRKEIGIRLALGASRSRVGQQLLTEAVVLAGFGALGGGVFAWALTHLAMSLQLPIPIPVSFILQIDRRVLAFTILTSLLAAVLAGTIPALRSSRQNLVDELKGDGLGSGGSDRRLILRKGLVVLQMAVTMVLLVVSGLLTRSLVAAQHASVGFRTEGLALLSTELGLIGYTAERSQGFYSQALERVRALPGVESVALAERSPMSVDYNHSRVFFQDRQVGDKGVEIDSTTVSGEYFSTMGVSMLQGRGFTSADTPTSPGVVIVNDAMARRFWPGSDAIGKHIRTRSATGATYEIVGIVADYKVNTIGEPATPYLHFAYSQKRDPGGEVFIARTRRDAGALVETMRRNLLALEPNLVFLESQTMETQVSATLLPARFGALGVSAVGIIAMTLAAIGLYGVLAYTVMQRKREIGVRMALGASAGSVVGLVMRDGLVVAGLGALVGGALALGAAGSLAHALYDVRPFDWPSWLGALSVILIAAVLANVVPAVRAARVSPSMALRSE